MVPKCRVEGWRLPGAGEWGKCRYFGQRGQTSSEKVNKFWGPNVQSHGCS